MKNRQFEIPFNHTEELLLFLENNSSKLSRRVKHVLVAPYYEDYTSTRHKQAKKPLDRNVYEDQIKRLQNANYTISLLFNMPETVEQSIIDYYIGLGIDTFIINSSVLAKTIHNLGCTTIASITKRLQLEDIKNEDLSMFDYIVLDYTFNASLDRIQKLPKQYKYILMLNTICDFTCDFYTHWRENNNLQCPILINGSKNSTYIPQEDLELFDEYISIYKLQGREFDTSYICKDIMYYIYGLKKYKIYNINTSGNYYYRYKEKEVKN